MERRNIEALFEQCEELDLDWTLVPPTLHRVCQLIGKGLKQTPTTVFLGLETLVSYCMGHSSVEVDGDWKEPAITWLTLAIPTGRCKSVFHQWLRDVLTDVAECLQIHGTEVDNMILSNCTWERFGERLADGGARQLGLFDELTSFFSTMNMYSSQKNTVSDNKEYQEFLTLFNGNSKNRETITGNANFHMNYQSFTMLGFTQPHSAMPIIKDMNNSAKGFTSRILWLFPKPIFCTMAERKLTAEERTEVKSFRDLLVQFLSCLYELGNSTYNITEINKVKVVKVKRREFSVRDDAQQEFNAVHDNWERVCEENKYDAFIGGLYARGRGQILRLSVPIQLLLFLIDYKEQHQQQEQQQQSSSESEQQDIIAEDDFLMNLSSASNYNRNPEPKPLKFRGEDIPQMVSNQALQISKSIVDTSIQQQRILIQQEPNPEHPMDALKPLLRQILQTPSAIVSFPVLIRQGMFRKAIQGESGKMLSQMCIERLNTYNVGQLETITTANCLKVTYLIKERPPNEESQENIINLATKLTPLGLSLRNYLDSFMETGEIFERHNQDYQSKKNNAGPSPSKRPRAQ